MPLHPARILLTVALVAAVGQAGYIIEWSSSNVGYSYATVYSSDTTVHYDATGDGIPDIFISDSGALRIFSGVTRGPVWTITASGFGTIGFPYITNTDGDPARELVLLGYNYSYPNYSGRFFIYDCASRSLEYSSPQRSGYPSLSVADVDGDGKSEILLVTGSPSRTLEVYGWDGAEVAEQPEPARLEQNNAVPSPTVRQVMLRLPAGPAGTVEIIDAAGRIVRRLPAAGSVTWDCCTDDGQPVPAGVYVYQLGNCRGRITVGR